MKPLRGENTPVEIISRSESVLGPSATLRRSSALRLRSSRSSSGARWFMSAPPCGTLVVYSVSTFIRSPPGNHRLGSREPAPHPSGQAGHAVIPGTLAHDPEPQLARVAAGDLEEVVVAHAGVLEFLPPLLPEEIRDEGRVAYDAGALLGRSEEHTSELQSRQYLVCRLLLEKKKTIDASLRTLTSRSLTHSTCWSPRSPPTTMSRQNLRSPSLYFTTQCQTGHRSSSTRPVSS